MEGGRQNGGDKGATGSGRQGNAREHAGAGACQLHRLHPSLPPPRHLLHNSFQLPLFDQIRFVDRHSHGQPGGLSAEQVARGGGGLEGGQRRREDQQHVVDVGDGGLCQLGGPGEDLLNHACRQGGGGGVVQAACAYMLLLHAVRCYMLLHMLLHAATCCIHACMLPGCASAAHPHLAFPGIPHTSPTPAHPVRPSSRCQRAAPGRRPAPLA